jgi:hypothetical protein
MIIGSVGIWVVGTALNQQRFFSISIYPHGFVESEIPFTKLLFLKGKYFPKTRD